MTMITASVQPDEGRVRIVYSDAVGGDLTRTPVGGVPTVVRGGAATTGYGILDDYECPFGVEVTYALDGSTDTATLGIGDAGESAWLSHPTDPSLTIAVLLIDDSPFDWSAPGQALPIIASEWPVIVHNRRTVHTGQLECVTGWDARDQMENILASGSPLLLRTLPGCKADDQWMWPETVTRTKVGTPDSDNLSWNMSYQRSDRPAGDVVAPPANAWSAVVQTHPDWSDVVLDHATWGDLLTTPHPHA